MSAGLALAQLDSNTVTVTASRNANPEPDQAIFYIAVDSGLTTTLGDVLSALQPSGITLANFSGVSTLWNSVTSISDQPPQGIVWTFTQAVSLTSTKSTVATLTQLQQRIAQSNSGLTLFFQIQRTQVSPQARQAQPCVAADLIADARAQAQTTAGSAGFTVLSILSMSGSTSGCSVTVTFAVGR